METVGLTHVRRLISQPILGIGMVLLALLCIGASWSRMGGGPGRGVGAASLLIAGCLGGAVVAAYQFPLHIRPKTKVYMSSVPFYLLAVLVAPPLAAAAAGAGALIGEASVRARRGTSPSQIATEVGRRAVVVLLGSLVAHAPGGAASSAGLLVGTALVLGVGDIVTFPLVLAGTGRQSFWGTAAAAARQSYLLEGAQYLLGLLGALAAAQQLWAPALLLPPTALVYVAFKRSQEVQAREREAHDQVAAALRVRDDFLTSASHDLRTPLTAIQGFVELVRTRLGSDPPPDAAWLSAQMERVYVGAVRMADTVDEISDVAQLQIGHQLGLRMEVIDLAALVREIAAGVAVPTAGATTARVLVDADGPCLVRGDRRRLERVVQNVIGNAVKYSPRGEPIDAAVGQEGRSVTICVRDRGVGIPAEELPYIFDLLYRASTARGIAGSGIGLAGAKAIIEQHGGQIAVESAIGQGTTVTIQLPALDGPRDDPRREDLGRMEKTCSATPRKSAGVDQGGRSR